MAVDFTSSVARFNRLADAIVDPLVDALEGQCIDEDFSLRDFPNVREACRRVVFRALASDPICCGSDESLLRAKSAVVAGFRVFRLGRLQYVVNLKSVGGVAYTVDCVSKYWPNFPTAVADEVEFLTSVEG